MFETEPDPIKSIFRSSLLETGFGTSDWLKMLTWLEMTNKNTLISAWSKLHWMQFLKDQVQDGQSWVEPILKIKP